MIDAGGDPVVGKPSRDARLAALLARYDEAAAAGHTQGNLEETPLPVEDQVILADARDCLQLLQDAWWPETPTIERSEAGVIGAPLSEGTDLLQFGRTVGRFEILRELGRGGFGIVFLAYDPRLKREVALKVPRPEAVWSPERRARFVREGHAAASLCHPNIVTVYEAQDDGPICCLAAEFVPGPTLSAWLREQTQPVAARTAAQWLFELAQAVQHAHDRGILHRDLKPSNVLLATVPHAMESNGTARGGASPEKHLSPKLTDFGLALWLEGSTEETQGAALLGTPRYMAPEQLRSDRKLIGAATDVYGLGAVLYEMLTGQAPFWGETDLEILRRAAADEPCSLGRLRPTLPRDLRTICEKCLEREPQRRYATAAELAADLQRFLQGLPIKARPARFWEHAVKWARRRPAVAALSAISAVVSVCLIVGAVNYNLTMRGYNRALERAIKKQLAATAEANEQRNAALMQGETIGQQAYLNQMHFLGGLFNSRQGRLLKDVVMEVDRTGGFETLGAFEWRFLQRLARGQRGELSLGREAITELAMAPDGSVCSVGMASGKISQVEPRTVWSFTFRLNHYGAISGLKYSPDSQVIAATDVGTSRNRSEMWLRNYGREKLLGLPAKLTAARDIAFSPDGRLVAAAGTPDIGGSGIVIYDAERGAVVAELKRKGIYRIHSVVFSGDSKQLFIGWQQRSGRTEGGIIAWDWTTDQATQPFEGLGEAVNSQVISADGKILVTACQDSTLKFWKVADGKPLVPSRTMPKGTTYLEISADGKVVLANCLLNPPGADSNVTLMFDTLTGLPMGTLWPTQARVNDIAVSLRHGLVLLGCEDGTLLVRELGAALEHHTRVGHQGEVWSVNFSPDGGTLLSAGDDHRMVAWDFTTGKQLGAMEGHDSLVTQAVHSPDGGTIASVSFDGTVVLWSAADRTFERRLNSGSSIRAVKFSANGKLLATVGDDKLGRIWIVDTGRLMHSLAGHGDKVRDLVFLKDGRTLISAGNDGHLIYWDVHTGKLSRRVEQISGMAQCMELTHDGSILATATWWGDIHLRDPKTGKVLKSLLGHSDTIMSLAFSPDGRTLASASLDKSVRLWNVKYGREVLAFSKLPAQVNDLAFSPAGSELVAALHDGSVRIWHTTADFFQEALSAK